MRTIYHRAWYAGTVLGFAAALLPTVALAACTQNAQLGTLVSPVIFCSVQDFVAGALRIIVTISLPIIGFFIVYTGYLFIAARGKEAALREAKKNFLYVIVGSGLIMGAWALATLIGATVSQFLG